MHRTVNNELYRSHTKGDNSKANSFHKGTGSGPADFFSLINAAQRVVCNPWCHKELLGNWGRAFLQTTTGWGWERVEAGCQSVQKLIKPLTLTQWLNWRKRPEAPLTSSCIFNLLCRGNFVYACASLSTWSRRGGQKTPIAPGTFLCQNHPTKSDVTSGWN